MMKKKFYKLLALVVTVVLIGWTKASLVERLEDEGFFESLCKNKIKVVAPASGVTEEEFHKLHGLLKKHVEFDVGIMDNSSLFHSKEDDSRAKDFIDAIQGDKDILWALRGGYGSAKLIDYLYKLKKPEKEKILVGYSDITALHLFLSQEWGWKSIHGAVVVELLDDSKNIDNFRELQDVLYKNKESNIELHKLNKAKVKRKLSGKIIGGNMSIIQNSIGTKWQIKTKDKILFLENIGTYGYKIDRRLNHFKEVGVFDDVKAVIFGDFHNADEHVNKVLEMFAEQACYPVFKTNLIGHGANNFPIVINAKARIKVLDGDRFSLITKLD